MPHKMKFMWNQTATTVTESCHTVIVKRKENELEWMRNVLQCILVLSMLYSASNNNNNNKKSTQLLLAFQLITQNITLFLSVQAVIMSELNIKSNRKSPCGAIRTNESQF